MKKTLLMMLFAVILGSIAFAQGESVDLNPKVPVDKKVRIGHLDNGLTYYLRVNKKPENRIQFRMVTNAGSILEDEAQRGLAHFCEHMAFNGIEGLPHNQMIDTLQKNGIEFGRGINAYTSFDETVYYVDMPADNPAMTDLGLAILNGWCGGLLFDPDELEAERGVIHEEWRGGLGANERLREKTWPIMLKGSKYAERLPIGLESVIMGFKRDDIVRFYKDWYRPDMQAIVIVGDFDLNTMENRVKEIFNKHAKPAQPTQRPTFDVPDNVEPLIAIAQDAEATSTTLELIWKHKKAAQGTVGDYRQSLVRSLVNAMISDRFRDLLEKPTTPVIAADAGYGGFIGRNCDAFTMYAVPKEGKIVEASEFLLTEFRRLDQHGFLQAELDRQKEELYSNYQKMAKEANKTQNNSLATEYTNHFLNGEVIPGIMQEFKYAKEFLPNITLAECNAMVSGWITDENMIYYLTAPEKVNVPTEQKVKSIINNYKTSKTTPWVDNFKNEPLYTKQLAEVTPKVTKENKALGYTEYTLPNGIKFIVKKTEYKADEIQMQSYAWGGTSMYNDADFYNAQNAAGFIDEGGIANFSATQLQKILKGKNVGIAPAIRQLSQGFNGSCSPKDFETMMQLLCLYYEAPRKDQEAFDRNIEALKTQIKFIEDNPQVAFQKTWYKTIYPNDKRSIIIPTEEQINNLNLDKMFKIYQERFCDASKQTFFFVGNMSDKEIALAAKYLNNLPTNGKQKKDKWVNREPKFAKGVVRGQAVKGSDNQGILLVYGETQGFKPTQHNRMVISQLSDCMEITALEVIREKMGGTYSPSVSVSGEILPNGQVTWLFYINVNPETSKDVENAAIEIIKGYQQNGPDAITLSKVQEQQIINRGTAMDNNGFWMGQIIGSYQYNEDRDANASLDEYGKQVKSVTADEIKAMAQKFLNLNNYAVITLVPETK